MSSKEDHALAEDDDNNDDYEKSSSLSSRNENSSSSAEAAGVVRGISRSIRSTGRALAKFPSIGELPRRAQVAVRSPRRLPVRQVATVSDRLSTGLDWVTLAVESDGTGDIPSRRRLKRVANFFTSLVKNTILGAAVFETYSYMVSYLVPPILKLEPDAVDQLLDGDNVDNDRYDSNDDYARASLGSHFVAGGCAGSVHAVASTIVESFGGDIYRHLRLLPAMTLHHVTAHALLFGSYESLKRGLLHQIPLDEEGLSEHTTNDNIIRQQPRDLGYLASVAMAGGLAGQIQHVASHYTEQWFGLMTDVGSTDKVVDMKGPTWWRLIPFAAASGPPALRQTLLAFPPSAIGFVAFEYGRSILT